MPGIQSLMQAPQGQGPMPGGMQGAPMPGQAPQGPMPGQAPMQQMPGMMPQQGAPTPQAMTGSLKNMPLDQLKMLYQNPQPGSPPLWAVISALAEKQKEAQAMMAARGQSVMAQNAQMQQQPPVAAQVVQAAEQMQRPTQMAAHGGMMHGYAGGGAVAFEEGGATEDIQDDPSLPLMERLRRSQKRAELSRQQGIGKSFAERFPRPEDIPAADTGDELLRMLRRAPAPTAAAATPMAPPTGRSLPTPQAAPRMQAAAPGLTLPTQLPDLPPERQAQIAADKLKAEELARSQTALAEKLGQVSPEVLAARERLQQVLGSAYDPQKKTLEEAKAQQAAGLFGNTEALGRMAAAAGGAKRFGQGLASAVGAGSEFMGEQRKRVQALQDRYNDLTAQLNITMAQAVHADAVGDDKLKREALMKAEAIKSDLFNMQRGIDKEGVAEKAQQATGLAALQQAAAHGFSAQAAMRSANKPTAQEFAYALFKTDPEKYKEFLAAGQEPKSEGAMLKEIVGAVLKNPLMMQQYPPAIQALVNQELLKLGVTSALPKGTPVRE